MTDPRAALAEERLAQAWHMTQRCVHGKGSGEPMQTVGYLDPDREVARDILDEYARLPPLAERGVLLVTKEQYSAERLEFLYATHPAPSRSDKYVAHDRGRCPRECWDWIAAALSGEVTA